MAQATPTRIRIGRQGRLVVPAALRRELGLEPGDELVARIDEGRLVLEPRDRLAARVRARFAGVEGSLADELIAERRADAAREEDRADR